MSSFLKNKKIVSILLIISLMVSFSPLFTLKVEAVVETAAQTAAATAIMTGVTAANTAAVPFFQVLGTGPLMVADYGVRATLLANLSTALGIAPGVAQKESIWDSIAYFAGRILVRMITQSIVTWINSGFQGNPSFIQDPEQFMVDTVDRTIGQFIFNTDLRFLCNPFETNIRLNLGLQYSPFKDKINCKLSSVLQNIDGSVTEAYNRFMGGDFIGGGGWESWLNITTVPQNNQLGAMIITQGELDARIGDVRLAKAEELNWSGGLLSMKKCVRTSYDNEGNELTSEAYDGDSHFYNPLATGSKVGGTSTSYDAVKNYRGETAETYSTKDDCKVVTPGVWITGTGNKVLGLDLDRLGAADEINEIVGALANFAISKVMQKGIALIKGEDLSPNNADWRTGLENMQTQQNRDIYSAGSNSSYQPSYSSYTNISSSAVDTQVLNAKNSLQSYIASVTTPEQAYYDAYNYIYTAATTMETKFQNIVACYQSKITSTVPTLTNSELNTANTRIDTASTTASSMTLVKTSVANNILASQANLTALQTISDTIETAYSIETLTAEQNKLTTLAPALHTIDQATEAQTISSTTISQIITNGPVGDNMMNQCNAFPNR